MFYTSNRYLKHTEVLLISSGLNLNYRTLKTDVRDSTETTPRIIRFSFSFLEPVWSLFVTVAEQ